MLINRNWLGRVFREEAADDGAADGGASGTQEQSNDDGQQTPPVEGQQQEHERPEWLLDKYATDGKTVDEATAEQAKAYKELSGKFGAFTGAPEEYAEVALSDELKEMGIEISADDPMLEAAKEFAKESNMSQEGFNGMVNLYAMQQVAEQKAQAEYKEQQLKALGPNANSRIENIQQWANKNLDPETIQGLEQIATSAESVKAIERLISMTRSAPMDADGSNNNAGATAEDVRSMQFEKDEHGNRRIATDPEFKARYIKLRNEVYGTEDHKQIIG